AHDHVERRCRFALGEVLAPHQLGDRVDHASTRPSGPAGNLPIEREDARRTKLPMTFFPSLVSTDSGWNCTPYVGCFAWRRPMTNPSCVQAVITSSGGTLDRLTISEW